MQGVCLELIAVYSTDEETIAGFQIKIALELHLSKSCHLLEKTIGLWYLRNVINRQNGFYKCKRSAHYFELLKDRRVNGRKGDGVCIYLRTNLNYRIRDDLINDDLECLIVEISKPRSSVFLVGTWYRPPNSPHERCNEFENVIDKIDAESKELYILGDVNCNLLPETSAHTSSCLTNIFDIYGLSQLITEPTRVTPVSKTLIDLCITNSPEKVSNSGVIHLGISDHSLVFMTRKIQHNRNCPRTIEMRQFKHFQKTSS